MFFKAEKNAQEVKMNVSLDVGLAQYDITRPTRSADSSRKDFGEAMGQSGAEQEKREGAAIGVGFPNQLSVEEHQRVEFLKNQAMQIASEAKGSLTASEVSQIKSIELEIGKITGMPMTEGLTEPAKKIAQQNQLELDSEEEAKFEAMTGQTRNGDSMQVDLTGQGGGMRMLQTKALVTRIKCMNIGM